MRQDVQLHSQTHVTPCMRSQPHGTAENKLACINTSSLESNYAHNLTKGLSHHIQPVLYEHSSARTVAGHQTHSKQHPPSFHLTPLLSSQWTCGMIHDIPKHGTHDCAWALYVLAGCLATSPCPSLFCGRVRSAWKMFQIMLGNRGMPVARRSICTAYQPHAWTPEFSEHFHSVC